MTIQFRPAADDDLVSVAEFLNTQRPGVGDRFLSEIERLLALIERSPGIGVVYLPPNPRLPGLRNCIVGAFSRYRIFYLSTPDGIEVIRILHTSRDSTTILAAEE